MVCTFSTSQLPKVVRPWCVLYILTSKCASRHNAVHFFNISTSKSGPNPSVFNTFYFQMCFAPQRRALFQHLNFQKWSEAAVFCTFSLRNRLRATTACNFFISHLASWLRTHRFSEPTFRPSGAPNHWKNTVFRDFPTFSRTCIFFLLIFSLLTLLPADCFFISPYCRKFDFLTSFDHMWPLHATMLVGYSCSSHVYFQIIYKQFSWNHQERSSLSFFQL